MKRILEVVFGAVVIGFMLYGFSSCKSDRNCVPDQSKLAGVCVPQEEAG